MKSLSLLILTLCLVQTTSFQFMSKWKLPTHDPNEAKIQEKFGDKSESTVSYLYDPSEDCKFLFCLFVCSHAYSSL